MTTRERFFRVFKAFAQGFFFGVPVCFTITDNFCTVCQVEGISMQPVLNHNDVNKDFVLINRWKAKKFDNIERGDIVSIVSPKDPTTVLIKRIIALEGDKIRTLTYKSRVVQIPRGHCWIEGDNRRHSLDSNSFGSVPLGLVSGVATRIIWPPSRWVKLTNELPPGRNPFDVSTYELSKKDDVIGDVKDSVNDELSNVVGEVNKNRTVISNMDVSIVDSKVSHEAKSELTSSSNVLTNLPQHARRHASDIANIET